MGQKNVKIQYKKIGGRKFFPEAFGSPGSDQTAFLAGTRALTCTSPTA